MLSGEWTCSSPREQPRRRWRGRTRARRRKSQKSAFVNNVHYLSQKKAKRGKKRQKEVKVEEIMYIMCRVVILEEPDGNHGRGPRSGFLPLTMKKKRSPRREFRLHLLIKRSALDKMKKKISFSPFLQCRQPYSQ